MTALAFATSAAPMIPAEVCLHEGAGVEMFTTSCTPLGGDMATGAGLDLFTTSCGPTLGGTVLGGGVELFTTSC